MQRTVFIDLTEDARSEDSGAERAPAEREKADGGVGAKAGKDSASTGREDAPRPLIAQAEPPRPVEVTIILGDEDGAPSVVDPPDVIYVSDSDDEDSKAPSLGEGGAGPAAAHAGHTRKLTQKPHSVAFELKEDDKALVLEFASEAVKYKEMYVDRNDAPMKRMEIMCDTLCGLRQKSRESTSREPRATHPFLQEKTDLAKRMLARIDANLPGILTAIEAAGIPNLERYFVYASIFVAKPGAEEQGVHYDEKDHPWTYYTCFIPVTNHAGQGDTEFGANDKKSFYTMEGAKIWGGGVLHKGGANRCDKDRVALALVLSKEPDENRSEGRRVPFRHPKGKKKDPRCKKTAQ